MPCDTVSTVSIDLGKVNSSIMLEALQALKLNPVLRGETIHFGFGEWINTKNGLSQLQQGRDVAEWSDADRVLSPQSPEHEHAQAHAGDVARHLPPRP